MPSPSDIRALPLPDERACPFGPSPEMAELRRRSPVTRVLCPTGIEAWLVTRYDDVREVLGDPARFSSRSGMAGHLLANQPPDAPVEEGDFHRMDGAEYLRFRRVMGPAVTTVKRTELFRPVVQRRVDELLDDLTGETAGPADLHARFANPLTSSVIAELLDIPEADRSVFANLAETLFDGTTAVEDLATVQVSLFGYLRTLVVERMRHPGEDVISVMAAKARQAEQPFTELELTKIAAALLAAGFDTTARAITYGVLALLNDPAQFAALRDDPALAPNAAEETLRLLAIGSGMLRVATVDTEIAGTPVAAGDYVVAAAQSANHDPARFTEPERLDVTRPRGPHLAFGHGPHQCPGQHIARLELTAVLATLPRRVPSLRLAGPLEEIEFRKDTSVFGPTRLPVTWDEIRP
ncbi:cytochrome P450 [Amycolatopsis sp. CA-230715]|uniref:cytochrome P450 n=1 Tax=Amycolatopsis sp. CA-230715 TaxID=2745196 RepID=UPI001C021091|nr:cytochrome P450 [Amycolatopsis sp. CA-230715]QWF80976.1 Vitamin D3 dihydroxylase [Amycolatopsis sp. CA-230715]